MNLHANREGVFSVNSISKSYDIKNNTKQVSLCAYVTVYHSKLLWRVKG